MASTRFTKPPTKADLRADLTRDIDRFLEDGGAIAHVAAGETGLEQRDSPLRAPLFSEPKSERTPLDHVAAELDARRKARLKRSPSVRRTRKPQARKKVIYDDFGEAIRTVWSDD